MLWFKVIGFVTFHIVHVNVKQLRQRQCFKSCFDDSDCRSRYRSCVCDYDCGMSCVKRGEDDFFFQMTFLIIDFINEGVSCPYLTPPDHGNIIYSNANKFSSRATYECDSGYVLEGSKHRHCQGDMWWGPSPILYRIVQKKV